MKNTNFNYLLILVSIGLASCGKKQSQESIPFVGNNEKLSVSSYRTAQEYSKNNANINMSPGGLLHPNYIKLKDEDKGRIRAVAYRFYKHVKVENGKLAINIKNGNEINISEPLFDMLYKNLNQANRFIDSLHQKGIKVDPPVITDDYLNSLISN